MKTNTTVYQKRERNGSFSERVTESSDSISSDFAKLEGKVEENLPEILCKVGIPSFLRGCSTAP